MDPDVVDPWLRYYQQVVENGQHCPIIWDIREDPLLTVRPTCNSDNTLSEMHPLYIRKATNPSSRSVAIMCDVLPEPWPIEAQNDDGVTIKDVLVTIYSSLQMRLKPSEWSRICSKQQRRITDVFYSRCRASADYETTKQAGVLRIDCLLHFTLFSGLTENIDDGNFILTVNQPR